MSATSFETLAPQDEDEMMGLTLRRAEGPSRRAETQ